MYTYTYRNLIVDWSLERERKKKFCRKERMRGNSQVEFTSKFVMLIDWMIADYV